MSGLNSLDPMVSGAEKAIEKMPPDKAVEFLLSKGVNPRLAGLVMKNRILKQAAQSQAQPPQKTVAQEIDDHVNSIAGARGQGISALPVPSQMFQGGAGISPQAPPVQHMADGGPVTDYMPQLMQAMYQKAAYQPGQSYQKPSYLMSDEEQAAATAAPRQGMAGGGIVAFAPGGNTGPYAQQAAADPNLQAEYAEYQKTHPVQRTPWTQPMASPLDAVGSVIGKGVGAIDRSLAAPAMAAQQQPQRPQMGSAPPGFPAPSEISHQQLTPEQMQAMAGQQPKPGPQIGAQPTQVPPSATSNSSSMSARVPVGGQVPGGMGSTPEEKAVMAQQQGVMAENKPGTVGSWYDKLQGIAEEHGVGEAAKAHLQELQDRHAQLSTMAQQGKWTALMDAGFAMAREATVNPHGGFLGALAVGGAKGGEEFKKTIAQTRELEWNLQDQKYAVKQAQENLINDRSKEAITLFNNATNRYDRMAEKMTDTQLKVLELTQGKQLAYQARMAQIQAAKAGRANYGNADSMVAREMLERGDKPEDVYNFMQTHGSRENAALTHLMGTPGWQSLEQQAARPPPNDDPKSDEYKRWEGRTQAAQKQMESMLRRVNPQGVGTATPANAPNARTYDPVTGTFK